ncbi:MAG TPA: UPF0280 family protein [Stellaceae bacterium]|nr:UPF0280 family protein [Stellaceae bacterium]
MTGPHFAILADGRRHFQHGPIDLVIEAFGPVTAVAAAYAAAERRFQAVLNELVAELWLLRRPLADERLWLDGPVARRMIAACWPYRDRFITPMAAVAGAVADEILAAMRAAGALDRIYVNNGGDIALHLAPGQRFDIGVAASPDPRSNAALAGRVSVLAGDGIGGIATSGRGGRSFSLGIADAVTVLAGDAASADAAATMIGNAVDIDHPAVRRAPASSIKDDTDLGGRLVTTGLGTLPEPAIAEALGRGEARAQALLDAGLIAGAVLLLRGRHRVVGRIALPLAA